MFCGEKNVTTHIVDLSLNSTFVSTIELCVTGISIILKVLWIIQWTEVSKNIELIKYCILEKESRRKEIR